VTDTNEAQKPLLEVRNLQTHFFTEDGVVRAVDGVDITVYPGEVLGIVGESGCGKSVTSLSIMRLIGQPGKVVGGEILFDGKDLLKLPESEMMTVRGNRISMIFQQPQTSLNPVFRVGEQIGEVLNVHQDFGKEAAQKRTVELLKLVGIPDAERRAEAFPHELSGGMAQRVMIAMALACLPDLLIADEPTTALDVTIQAQILDLMRKHARTIRVGGHPHHARSRRYRRNGRSRRSYVRRRNRRTNDCAQPVQGTLASLYKRVDRLNARAWARARKIRRDPRRGSQPRQPAEGMPVCAAMRRAHST
jgi:ABC-type dipeptide/oligopeptide/nickel transport system ATPase subunit